jgi:hypothetical protein
MGRHVGCARSLTCGSGRGYCGRVAGLPSRRLGPGCEGSGSSDSQFSAGKGAQAVDGLAGACVARGLGGKKRQASVGLVVPT